MNICESNKIISREIKDFILNVQDVKEESITDYLAWKWRELDSRFNYLSIHTFTHEEESKTTGADFDLELWLVGRKTHTVLAVQAKKFLKQHDSYVRKLRYPDGTKQQMDTLLSYSKINNKRPFYFIYSAPELTSSTLCAAKRVEGGIFMADAKVMEKFADGKHGKRVSRDDLLAKSNPFHCIFCCPMGSIDKYLNSYFPENEGDSKELPNDALPNYVIKLLNEEGSEQVKKTRGNIKNRGWERFKAVGVYDLRNDA
jgi:hypothetical protein